jgi:tRNA modification GTPase
VSDIPGVTRDALTESFRLGHLLIKLTDTAGIRDTGEHIEQMGVERSYKAAKDADMILWVLDSSNELTSEDYHIYETVVHSADANTVGVLNKSDLRNMLDDQELASKFDLPFIRVSATDGSGINDLKIHIINTFTPDKIQASEDIITNVRHKDALERASNYLRRASDNALQGLPEDFISMELSEAYNSLGEILGEKANEDLINKIFDSFCVGK